MLTPRCIRQAQASYEVKIYHVKKMGHTKVEPPAGNEAAGLYSQMPRTMLPHYGTAMQDKRRPVKWLPRRPIPPHFEYHFAQGTGEVHDAVAGLFLSLS